jgi:phosphonate transport system substrate-binding protein
LRVIVSLPHSYSTLIEAMGQNTVQVGWLPPFAYVAAHEQGYANAGLATLQAGATRRGVQFMVNADWLAANAISLTLPLTQTETLTATLEPAATPSAVDDVHALRQLAGRKPCWVDATSTSGYLIPRGILKLADIATPSGTFLNTSGEVVRTLYNDPTGETCEFGATFIDARQGVSLPDLNQRVQIIYFSAPIIPFDTVAFAAGLPAAQREAIISALLTLAKTEAGQRALKDVYDVDGVTRSDDSFYNAFRLYIDAAGADPRGLIE